MFKTTTAPQDPLILQLVPIVTQACEILREEYRRYCSGADFDVERKSDDSPVTQADYRANSYITQALSKVSNLPVLSEEGDKSERMQWQKFWLLDPLDGTKEFLHKRPEFTINLSLVEGANTTFAILAIPGEYSVYICPFAGFPLKYDSQSTTWYEYVQTSVENVVHVGLSQSAKNKPIYKHYLDALEKLTPYQTYHAGSAYKFCMMLEDRVDIYPRFHPTCEWDTSAGQCLIERIGGGLVDFKGRAFLYNQRTTLLNGGFIAFKNAEMKELALNALANMPDKT
ncbi:MULTISPECIES: 3'(2'),5'-bisphosphate nucleotidase CysQ [unclassified Acinetobacter]|uniref:3'(2'),5'-bisphosphate nucleotidase CysQ family protein n=1 Tax=unclassified Acinetobacter TaxID=196816 RepID=UPI0015D2A991|nr:MULTISPECIES: 3'(2'),5'-bisphosphate nucleotidase CysQ [unclassified Acinetobacter]QOW49920.1 3'(2'),5'-bisphosphate nucleotidase CysQ [Acinetobacter sp. YH12138]